MAVTDLYHKLLHRFPDAEGHDFWVGVYWKLLGRLPEPGGLNYRAGVLPIRGDLTLAADLAISNEYYNRAQGRF